MATCTRQSIVLWPNPLPLECGVIRAHDRSRRAGSASGSASGRLSIQQLKKMVSYTKGKGKTAYPNLRYRVWSHIVKNKLGGAMPEELAWLLFETFDVVSDDIGADERLQLLQMTAKCSTKEELDELRMKLSVDTARFILFLYIQNIPRLSLKSSLLTGEEWPSPEAEKKQKSPEYAHLSFLKSHLSEILGLFAEPGGLGSGTVISLESAQALDFLICSSKHGRRTTSLSELASSSGEASKSGYSKISKSFSTSHFEQWIKQHLTINPQGPQSLLKKKGEVRTLCYRSETVGKILTSSADDCHCAVLRGINKQTLAKCDQSLEDSNVYITNCRRSTIYLLGPLKSVQVEKCSRCVLVLGVVGAAVSVSNCDSITIITACRRLQISSCSLCVFHSMTTTRPVVSSACLRLTFAPYNTHYPMLGRHLALCGLGSDLNYWDQPLLIGDEVEPGVWELMPPPCFRPIAIPFKLEGETEDNPFPLPQTYLEELATRRKRVQHWYTGLDRLGLSEQQKSQLQATVKEKFEEWLSESGHRKEIVDLEPSQPSISPASLSQSQ